jgi:hypothetical protein
MPEDRLKRVPYNLKSQDTCPVSGVKEGITPRGYEYPGERKR